MDEPLRYRCEIEFDGNADSWDFLSAGEGCATDALRLEILRLSSMKPKHGGRLRFLFDLRAVGVTVFDAHSPNWDAEIAGRAMEHPRLQAREVVVYTWDNVDQFPGHPYVIKAKTASKFTK